MKKYDRLKYILPPVLTASLLFIIYAIKGIYPLGKNTVDFYDLSNQIVTYYCHVFDVLHGEKNLFYDVYTALGTNMVGTCGSSNISIFNLFFLFIKRESILKSMSVFLLIKMMAMSFSMFLFLDKVSSNQSKKMEKKNTENNYFSILDLFNILFSIGYAFSGFVLTTFTIMQWQDIVAFFPIVMLGLYKLVKEGNNRLYIVALTMSLIAGYYISIMIIIYVFLIVGFTVFTKWIVNSREEKKCNKNYHIFNLLVSTLCSMLISAFVLVPQIIQTLSSSRFGNEAGSGITGMYINLLEHVKPAYTTRWFTLACLALPVAIILYSILKTKNKKIALYTIFIFIILFSELFIESINLIWHYGSYVHYPIRNGFMISFSIYAIASVCLQKLYEDNMCLLNCDWHRDKLCIYGVILTAILSTIIIAYYSSRDDLIVRNVFHIFAAISTVCFVIYFISLLVNRQSTKAVLIQILPFVFMSEIIFWGYVFIGPPAYKTGYTEEPEMENDYYYICNQLYDEFDELKEGNVFVRMKNPDLSLNSNYGLVIRNSTLSNWTALLPPEIQRDAKRLGYSTQYTRVLDGGGTIFSDSFLGIKWIVTCIPQNEELYKLVKTAEIITDRETGKKEKYYLYENRFVLPYGFVSDNVNVNNTDFDEVDLYNYLYECISGDGDGIAEWIDISDNIDKEECKVVISLEGKRALYYFSNQVDTDDYNTMIAVNGATVSVPSVKEQENDLYPAHFNNNALLLGVFTDDNVNLNIHFANEDKFGSEIERSFSPRIMAIDIEKLGILASNHDDVITDREFDKAKYVFTINQGYNGSTNNNEQYLVVPISYDKGYDVTVNDKKTELIKVLGLVSAVKLDGCNNSISISFMPNGMKEGIVLSVLGLISIVVIVCIDVRNGMLNKEYKWVEYLYSAAFVAAISLMYVIPFIYAVAIGLNK